MFVHYPVPHRCPDCNELYWPQNGEHECDVDTKFLHQQAKQRNEQLQAETAKAELELRPENLAATILRWEQNATAPPLPADAPEEECPRVSLPALREFIKWQREHGG